MTSARHTGWIASRKAREDKPLRLSRPELTQLLTELSDLLDAGCQLGRALAVLQRQVEEPRLAAVVDALHQEIIDGRSLAEAMTCVGCFSETQVAMVRSAEAGGFLQRTLAHMAGHGRQQMELIRGIRSRLTYPIVLFVTAVASVVFLLAYVVPRFTRIYQAAQRDLPAPTRAVLAVSGFLASSWWLALLLAAGAVVAFRLAKRNLRLHNALDRAILRVPLVGPLIRDFAMSEFTRTMALLLQGGMSALRSLGLAGQMLRNSSLRQEIDRLAAAVEQGEAIGQQMRGGTFFSPATAELISVGEESGKLPAVLGRLADQHRQRFETRLATVTALVEPAVILVVGVMIGLIVAALLLPVLLMSTLVG